MVFQRLQIQPKFEKAWGICLALQLLSFASCATTQSPIDDKSILLGTSGSSKSMYHIVAGYKDPNNTTNEVKLKHEGFLIAIEKAPRKNICAPEKNLDTSRFNYPEKGNSNDTEIAREGKNTRLKNMERITDDPKIMFISHIVSYDGKTPSNNRFLHNIYNKPLTLNCQSHQDNSSPYKQGWDALDRLEDELTEKVENAATTKEPFTHIVVMAMGWNNDQKESVTRYNKIMKHMKEAARIRNQKFKPLLIGFSWPSVWGTSTIPGWKQILHIFSYGNKADDADEVGFTYGNHIINKMVLGIKDKIHEEKKPEIVLIGHSMGARLLTRAIFSAHLLKNHQPFDSHIDYVFGLEGAFSINRFVEGSRLLFPISLFRSGEGFPYANYGNLESKLLMTWSRNDKANPFSTFLNGSAHIGGVMGFKRSRKPKKRKPFTHLKWAPSQNWQKLKPDVKEGNEKLAESYEKVECKELIPSKSNNKVFMADLTDYVDDHNDICDFQMGNFIWEAMRCFSRNDSNNNHGNPQISNINLNEFSKKLDTEETCKINASD